MRPVPRQGLFEGAGYDPGDDEFRPIEIGRSLNEIALRELRGVVGIEILGYSFRLRRSPREDLVGQRWEVELRLFNGEHDIACVR